MKYFFILFLHYGKGCRRKTNTLVGKKIKDLGMGKFWLKKKKRWVAGSHPPCYCNFGYIYIYISYYPNQCLITIYDFIYVNMDRS